MTINELIRKVFKDSGLTYDEISQKTGISKSTLRGYAPECLSTHLQRSRGSIQAEARSIVVIKL